MASAALAQGAGDSNQTQPTTFTRVKEGPEPDQFEIRAFGGELKGPGAYAVFVCIPILLLVAIFCAIVACCSSSYCCCTDPDESETDNGAPRSEKYLNELG